jgi:hypothetical protein
MMLCSSNELPAALAVMHMHITIRMLGTRGTSDSYTTSISCEEAIISESRYVHQWAILLAMPDERSCIF